MRISELAVGKIGVSFKREMPTGKDTGSMQSLIKLWVQTVFTMEWLKRIAKLLSDDIIAIDGKSLCGSKRLNACQKALHIINAWSCANRVRQICEADADYVIALKGNQGTLHELVKDSFVLNDQGSQALKVYRADDQIVAEHGRIEERFIEVIGR